MVYIITMKNLNITLHNIVNTFLLFVIILFGIHIIFINLPLGTAEYQDEISKVTLEIPAYSEFVESCCMHSITFESTRSIWGLKSQIMKMLKSYKEVNCNNKTAYYNEKGNYTITEWGVESGLLKNKFYFVYSSGNYCGNNIISNI